MPINLELKIKIDSFEKFLTKLDSTGAVFEGELLQKDVYYEAENQLLKLRTENGRHFLIRYIRNEKGNDRWSDFELIKIGDDKAESFFNKIFKVTAVVNKRRLLYLYNNSRIHLDEVAELGKFLEIETMVRDDQKEAKLRFDRLIEILNIDTSKEIRDSYRNIINQRKDDSFKS